MKITNNIIFSLIMIFSLNAYATTNVNCITLVKKSELTRVDRADARTYIAINSRDLINESFIENQYTYTEGLADYLVYSGSLEILKKMIVCISRRDKNIPSIARDIVNKFTSKK